MDRASMKLLFVTATPGFIGSIARIDFVLTGMRKSQLPGNKGKGCCQIHTSFRLGNRGIRGDTGYRRHEE